MKLDVFGNEIKEEIEEEIIKEKPKYKIFDYSDSIIEKKKYLGEELYGYNKRAIDTILSYNSNAIIYANEMNLIHEQISDKMHYDYYYHGIRKQKKIFAKSYKSEAEERIEIIKRYYNFSERKAKEVKHLFSIEQIDEMRHHLEYGVTDK